MSTILLEKQQNGFNRALERVFNWLVKQINLNIQNNNLAPLDAEVFNDFKEDLFNYANERYLKIKCCNLRTTSRDTKLCQLAGKCGIPFNYLPENVSLIISDTLFAYYKTPTTLGNNPI